MKPLISIIVLTYNQEATIGRTLGFLVSQRTEYPIEIVVTDDCSSDRTAEICRQYADRYPTLIRFHRNATNLGLVENYFRTFERCRGELIADCAGDDCWTQNAYLDQRIRLLEQHPEAQLVFSPWIEVSDNGDEKPCGPDETDRPTEGSQTVSGRLLLRELLASKRPRPLHLSAIIYRGDTVSKLLKSRREDICNEEFGCEDTPTLAALLSRGDAVWFDRPTLRYTVSDDSITGTRDHRKAALTYSRFVVAHYRLARIYGVPLSYIRRAQSRKADFALRMAQKSGDRKLLRRIVEVFKREGVSLGWKGCMIRFISKLLG